MAGIAAIRAGFPRLLGEFAITSAESDYYNCIAWAAGDTAQCWWPIRGYYWPPEVERQRTVECFVAAFRILGYESCGNAEFETGYEKVAIYVDRLDRPTHMARQLSTEWWTSKLGNGEDIIHKIEGVEGPGVVGADYGRVVGVLRRPRAEVSSTETIQGI